MKKIVVAVCALALAGPAFAETYRAIQGGATNVIYVVPESRKKEGDKAEASVVAILGAPRSNGVIAQELPMAVDCKAKTFQQTATIDLDATRKEIGRKASAGAPQSAPKGTLGETIISFACTGRLADDKVQTFSSFQQAIAGTKDYVEANKNAAQRAAVLTAEKVAAADKAAADKAAAEKAKAK